jgi:hypothetical protein
MTFSDPPGLACAAGRIRILGLITVNNVHRRTSAGNFMPNLPGRTAIYRFRQQ